MTNSPASVVYLGLGSNLNAPCEQLSAARLALRAHSAIEELACSSFYHSKPQGPQDQPDYVNAVLAIKTRLAPLELLGYTQHIENAQGRVRGQRWGARTLDIDILMYGEQVIHLEHLIVPHVQLAHRAFVLYPLHEIAPTLHIPLLGSVMDLLQKCPKGELHRLPSAMTGQPLT